MWIWGLEIQEARNVQINDVTSEKQRKGQKKLTFQYPMFIHIVSGSTICAFRTL
jgi:hypothetical protein